MRAVKEHYENSYSDIAKRLGLERNQVISIERAAFKKIKKLLALRDEDFAERICEQDKRKKQADS